MDVFIIKNFKNLLITLLLVCVVACALSGVSATTKVAEKNNAISFDLDEDVVPLSVPDDVKSELENDNGNSVRSRPPLPPGPIRVPNPIPDPFPPKIKSIEDPYGLIDTFEVELPNQGGPVVKCCAIAIPLGINAQIETPKLPSVVSTLADQSEGKLEEINNPNDISTRKTIVDGMANEELGYVAIQYDDGTIVVYKLVK